jgi:predicted dehydrogenase
MECGVGIVGPGLAAELQAWAIAAGKHVLVEKPLELSLKGCDLIIGAARRRGVRAGGIFQSRFFEGARLLKKAIEEGRFGRLVLGLASVKWWRSQEYYDRGGWKSLAAHGGGALMNQAIHAVDLLQWFMGPVRSAQAVAGTPGHERLEAEDTAAADPAAIGLAGHRALFEDFAACLRENRPPLVDAAEARKAVALILAIYRSARTGRLARPAP